MSRKFAARALAGAAAAASALCAAAIGVAQTAPAQTAELQEPRWAYAIPPARPPGAPAPQPQAADDPTLHRLPGTDRTFTLRQIRGGRLPNSTTVIAPADWYPEDHPAMPDIVAYGDPARGIIACSLCHYPNGQGRGENAGLSGLSKAYMAQQLRDMRDGLRRSAEPRKANAASMVKMAEAMTEAEIEASAAYFASMPWRPWVRVVESRTAPKVRNAGGLMLPLEGAEAGVEPVGARIVEVPEHPERTELQRDPRSGFVAYTPVGAIAKGKALVATGGRGVTVACGLCHGADLNGIGPVPAIASRSPSYIARALNDFQKGARRGEMAEMMKPVVAKLTPTDMLNIAAYVASLPVKPPTTATAATPPRS